MACFPSAGPVLKHFIHMSPLKSLNNSWPYSQDAHFKGRKDLPCFSQFAKG